jgi:hypothetical protein
MTGAAATGLGLPIGRYRAWFSSSRPVRFSEFPGSAWRGGFGYALKKAACATGEARCETCLLYRSCAYPYIFETPPPPGAAKMRRYTSVPHPFVFDHGALPDGEAHGCLLEFSLFGAANRHLPIIVYALVSAGAAEQGIAGNRLRLERLEREAGLGSDAWVAVVLPEGLAGLGVPGLAEPPVPRTALELRIETPLRLKRDGRHVGPERFRFADLFGNLLRRISMLTYFHTETPLETDFRGLSEAARAVPCEFELEWKEQRRYSHRQGEVMRLGGVVGRIALQPDGSDLAPFWPYLWLGQWTHAGTGATMGLGRYRIVG